MKEIYSKFIVVLHKAFLFLKWFYHQWLSEKPEPLKKMSVETWFIERFPKYLMTFFLVVLSFATRLIAETIVGPLPAYLVAFPVVMIITLLSGFRFGIFTIFLVSFESIYWASHPHNFNIQVSLILFIIIGIFTSWLADSYKKNKDKIASIMLLAEKELANKKISITEKEKLLAEKEFEILTHMSPVGIFQANHKGKCIFVNEKWIEMTGCSLEKALNDGWTDYIYPEDKEQVINDWNISVVAGTEFSKTYRYLNPNGKVSWVQVNDRVIKDDGVIIGFIRTCTDITEHKSIEEDLIRSNTDLKNFAFIASHDLQDPLKTMNVYLKLLHKECDDCLSKKNISKYIEIALESNTRLQNMVSNLLKYARAEHVALIKKPVNSEKIVREIIADFAVIIADINASIATDNMPIISADEVQIREVFQNIIQNAIKYRSPLRPLIIYIDCKQEKDKWIFSITDNGIGITKELLPKLFTPFRQISGKSSGMGLAIVKRIVERHDGEIWLQSKEGIGTTFYFSIVK